MRSRNIKPGFFKNEDLSDLPFSTRLLFIGLWCLADRRGLLEDRPRRIKIELFADEAVDIEDGLAGLADKKLITRYVSEESGVPTIFINNFHRHQNPHKNETSNKLLHMPSNYASSTVHGQPLDEALRLIPSSLIPDSCSLIPDCPPTEGSPESFALSVPAAPPAILIPVREGDEPIQRHEVDTWSGLYGNIDVPATLNRIRGHWLSKPANQRKTRRGIRTSINTWLAKDHDRARTAGTAPGIDGRAARTKQAMIQVLAELEGKSNA